MTKGVGMGVSIGGKCPPMFSFEKYRKRYLFQFFCDLGLTCLVVFIAVYFNRNEALKGCFFWALGLLLFLGLLRLAVLLNWLLRSIMLRNLWLSIFSVFHLAILGVCLWWGMFLLLIVAGIIGITPDGTERRY